MSTTASATALAWPGFRRDGGLLLPLPHALVALPGRGWLELDGQRYIPKLELHVTLLNRRVGTLLRDASGEHVVRRHFEAQDWIVSRTGEARLLHKTKHAGIQDRPLDCASIIERLQLPALARFRTSVARAAQMDVPALLPHVTLYTAGDPAGIGLPDLAALDAAHVAHLRLPGVCNRAPPRLSHELLAAYQAAHYVIDSQPPLALKIGEASSRMDDVLQAHGSRRAIIVTAFNPFSEPTDSRANNLRQQMLRHWLRDAGMLVRDAEGRDPAGQWPAEPGLLVFGTEPAFEDRLLQDFEQHALVVVTPDQPVALALHPDHRD